MVARSKTQKLVAKAKKFLKKDKQPPRMTPDEKRLIRDMHFGQKLPPSKIAELMNREISSVCRLLAQKKAPPWAPR